MTDVLDFLPVFSETLSRIRARMDADANAGLDPSDPGFIDIREGSFYWDMTQVAALEIARLWDALAVETVAAAFPSVAWGDYLDEHAATFGLTRNPAVSAVGTVLFSGTAGTLIPVGALVSAEPADPSQDAVTFQVTQSGSTCAAVPAPSGVVGVPNTSSGALAPGTYIYHLTSYNDFGESMAATDVIVTLSALGEVSLSWSAVTGATGYRVYRSVTSGRTGQEIGDVTATAFMDLGSVMPGVLEPSADTTSGALLTVQAITPGSDGNLGANAITVMETLLPTINTITNPLPTTGGADPEDDEPLRDRILAQYTGHGAGTQADYVRWALATTGVERAACIPVWAGAGTVLVIAMLADGSPVATSIVTGLQAQLDPVAGQGHGQAPIGATVTVATTVALTVDIAAALTFAPAYSLDGASGTIATRTEIESALNNYLLGLDPGGTIGYQQLQAVFFTVEGVTQVNSLTINSGTADIVLGTSPAQYPQFNTPTLT